jgi:hypothetical protein
MAIAYGLILIGILFLLNNLGIMRGDFWQYIWPLVFILIGISLITKRTGKGGR